MLTPPGPDPEVSSANEFCYRLFDDGDRLYDDMLVAIEQARHSIRLEYYILENDNIGDRFVDALCRRARDGLSVRVHLDTFGSVGLLLSGKPERLRTAGVELHWFNPFRFRKLSRFNRRNHRKLLVVDDETAWLGGFNIQEQCSRRYHGDEHWRDTHIRLEGALARQARDYFDHLWQGRRHWQPQLSHRDQVFLVSNQNFRQTHRFRRLLQWHMRRATTRVWLTTPYFTPDRGTQKGMVEAARRGVDVRLLVPAKSDAAIARWAARAAYDKLLAAGVRIFEYQPRLLHAKTAIVDDHWSTIGTANLNYRSFYVNLELNLIADAAALNRELREAFVGDLGQAKEVFPRHRRRRSLSARFAELIGWAARKYL